MGRRRYHDPEPCPECGRLTSLLIPWRGDGTLSRFVAHGPVADRCAGSGELDKLSRSRHANPLSAGW